MTQPTFIELCKKLIGSDHVITDPAKMLPFVTDYRKRFTGKALAAVFPGHTRQVADEMCIRDRVYAVVNDPVDFSLMGQK